MKTLKNKLCALLLIACGVVATFTIEEGLGALVLMLFFAIPLFFAKEDCTWHDDEEDEL